MPASNISNEELHAVRDLILLHQCLGTLEFRLARTAEAEREQVQRIIDKVTADFFVLKNKLKDRDIHVFFDRAEDNVAAVKYPFVCRGYDDRFFTLKDHYRGQIKEILKGYRA